MQTKVRPLGALGATVSKRLSGTAARSRLKGKPSFRFGLSTVRFGLITVAVIAVGVALLTWLPSDAYNQPITHPVKAIADSVTKEPPKAQESKAVNVVRKGLETVSAGILTPISDQPASPSSAEPVPQAPAASEPPPAPKASTPASGTAPTPAPTPALSTDAPESSYEEPPALPATPAPVLEPEPAPAYDEAPPPAATPEPAPAYDEAPPPYEEPPPADPVASPTDTPTDPRTAPPPQGQVDGCEPPNCTITQDPGPNSGPDRN